MIAHPTRQHSHRLARALEEDGSLDSYCTLLPEYRTFDFLPEFLKRLLPDMLHRHSLDFLPGSTVNVLLGPLALQKLGSRLPLKLSVFADLLTWSIFDRWVARRVRKHRPSVIVGYEMCCAETFRAAKELGIFCVLDAASFHYEMQDRVLGTGFVAANTWAGKRLRDRKRKEIELADTIVCVSTPAKSSYVEAGVDEERVLLNPVGCDTSLFAPADTDGRTGSPRFIYVGAPAFHKGFDVLLECYDQLLVQYPGVELHFVGDALSARHMIKSRNVIVHGKLSHSRLPEILATSDCLILPSRLESFGMVVVEALAAGVPVIVSDHAGASQAVRPDVNGWLIAAGDRGQLLDRMALCCGNISLLRSMRRACVASAAEYDWSNYSIRAKSIFAAIDNVGSAN